MPLISTDYRLSLPPFHLSHRQQVYQEPTHPAIPPKPNPTFPLVYTHSFDLVATLLELVVELVVILPHLSLDDHLVPDELLSMMQEQQWTKCITKPVSWLIGGRNGNMSREYSICR
jgi:hypothetical protein